MSNAPSSPKHRRWRWLVGGMIALPLVAVAVAISGDRRVVGTWVVGPDVPFRDDRLVMKLEPYGVGTFELRDPQSHEKKIHDRFRWRAVGDRLYIVGRIESGPVAAVKAIVRNIKDGIHERGSGLRPFVEPSGLVETIENNGELLRSVEFPDSTMVRLK